MLEYSAHTRLSKGRCLDGSHEGFHGTRARPIPVVKGNMTITSDAQNLQVIPPHFLMLSSYQAQWADVRCCAAGDINRSGGILMLEQVFIQKSDRWGRKPIIFIKIKGNYWKIQTLLRCM